MELTRLRQICCDPGLLFEGYKGESAKAQMCMELIENAVGAGHKGVIVLAVYVHAGTSGGRA